MKKLHIALLAAAICLPAAAQDLNSAYFLDGYKYRHRLNPALAPSRSYFSWLFGRKREYTLDARVKGSERHMIMSGEYDRVLPMDILPEFLIKAILAGDIDRMEALGIYEVAPEDFALCEFVDSSKLELQRIVREGLDMLRRENEGD